VHKKLYNIMCVHLFTSSAGHEYLDAPVPVS